MYVGSCPVFFPLCLLNVMKLLVFATRDWGNLISGFGSTASGVHYIGFTCSPTESHVLGVTITPH